MMEGSQFFTNIAILYAQHLSLMSSNCLGASCNASCKLA